MEIERIDALIAKLSGEVPAEWLALALQRLVPGLTCRQCDAEDVLEEPFRVGASFDLHLLDTAGHCIRVTADPAEAGAVLIAARQPA
jgi:hypothetical protein